MTKSPTCDFCGTRIDTTSPDALVVAVHRGVDASEWSETEGDYLSGGVDTFGFCSQAHLAEHMTATPLPATPAVDLDDDDGGTLGCLVTTLLGSLLLTALMIGALYGLFLLFESWR